MVVNEHQISLCIATWSFSVTWISDSYIFITKPTLANASIYFVVCWGTGGPSWVWNNYVLICFVFSWSIILVICGYKSHSIFELFIRKLNRKKGSKHEHLTSATAISKISNFFSFYGKNCFLTFSHIEAISIFIRFIRTKKFESRNCFRFSIWIYVVVECIW